MTYQTDAQILEIVRAFETARIKREDWRHAEHLTVACYYALHHDYETAHGKMRGGIFSLLDAFGVDLSKEMPYHETLTVFWLRMIFDALKNQSAPSLTVFTNQILEIGGDKELPLKFYRRETLFSEKARQEYIAPDLIKAPFGV